MNEEQWRALDRIDQYDVEPLRLYGLIGKLQSLDKNKKVKIVYSDGSVAYPNVLERDIVTNPLEERDIVINLLEERDVVYQSGHFEECFSCFVSWRGGYENLSIDISKTEKHVTVGNLLEQCQYVIRKLLYGYKGGLFSMDGSKIVYVSEASEGDKCAIFDVKETGDEVHLIAKRYLCGWF